MTISFSGLTFQIQLLYPGTERFFAGFLTDSPSYTACLRVTQEDLRQAACYCPADASPEFLETVALRRRLADLLCFLMTAACFIVRPWCSGNRRTCLPPPAALGRRPS